MLIEWKRKKRFFRISKRFILFHIFSQIQYAYSSLLLNIKQQIYLLYSTDEHIVFPSGVDSFVLISNHVCTLNRPTLQLPFALPPSLSLSHCHIVIITLYVLITVLLCAAKFYCIVYIQY